MKGSECKPRLSPQEIETLVSMRLLLPRRDVASAECFWFSHPAVGLFVQNILRGRTDILKAVGACKNKEIAESDLEKYLSAGVVQETFRAGGKRKLADVLPPRGADSRGVSQPMSVPKLAYAFKFHLYDVLGRDSLMRVLLPSVDGCERYLVRIIV